MNRVWKPGDSAMYRPVNGGTELQPGQIIVLVKKIYDVTDGRPGWIWEGGPEYRGIYEECLYWPDDGCYDKSDWEELKNIWTPGEFIEL